MIKNILKRVLVWITVLSFFLFIIGGAEHFVESGNWLIAGFWLIIETVLVYICYCTTSYKDWRKALGSEYFENWLNNKE